MSLFLKTYKVSENLLQTILSGVLTGIVMMTTVLTAAGLPLEGVAILAGVDRLIDSFHTLLNVIGNVANAAILERWEPSEEEATTTESLQVEEI